VETAQGTYREQHVRLRRTLLDPQRIKELSKLRPALVVRDTLVCWAIIFGAWVAAASIDTWWAVAAAFVIVGNRFYALFIIGHDGMHRRLFPKTSTNDLFTDVFVLANIGAINRINNRNHLRHHQSLATEADPDRHKHACFNKTTPMATLGYLTGTSSVLRNIGNVFRGERESRVKDPDRPKYSLRDLAILLGCQGSLIVGLTLGFGWWGYPVLWLAPVYVFTIMADNFRTFVEHSHPEADHLADAHRLVTNDPPLLEKVLFAPMHMHHHAAHHLWPSIPYYNLPAADAELRQSPGAAELEWRGSYLGYLRRYTRALPIVGCERRSATAASA
jgi:fatty acid desaturase